jgi:hypothetical protein
LERRHADLPGQPRPRAQKADYRQGRMTRSA